jgi:hypothetical protein
MFPEGGRTKKGPIRPFKTGAARMVIFNKVPYIPVAALGNRDILKGKAHIRVGTPVYLRDDLDPNDKTVLQEIADDMQKQVVALYFNKPQPPARYEKKSTPHTPLLTSNFNRFQPPSLIAQKSSPILAVREINIPETYSYHDNERKIFNI